MRGEDIPAGGRGKKRGERGERGGGVMAPCYVVGKFIVVVYTN